ncbi:hypothetical protein [Chlamydia sp. 17-3921]|uniref:hypothetical protein n=1 Tax=Chlamydia sp. 17-3921 TaxID=2675798 RepID=UPI0019184074|nr:hypothetical protein [Chlamydia sp. 17-3921]
MQFYSLDSYVRDIPEYTHYKRSIRALANVVITFYVLAIIIGFLIIYSAGLSLGVTLACVSTYILGVILLSAFLLLLGFSRRDELFSRNKVHDAHYRGLHFWNLTRRALTKFSETLPYNKALYAPFKKYLPEESLLVKISLILEHFIENPPPTSLIYKAKIFRDYRKNPDSVFFPVFENKNNKIICEAFCNDESAHNAMKDCYRLIFAKNLINKAEFKVLDVISSSMAEVDYPAPRNDVGRRGLVRLYYDQEPSEDDFFPSLIPNYRLPQGPLYHPLRQSMGKKEETVLQGLEELLQLCLQQEFFFALQWDNIYFDSRTTNPSLKIRSMNPAIVTHSPEHGIVCEALAQWASVLGSEEQIKWMASKLDKLAFPKRLGNQNAEVFSNGVEATLETEEDKILEAAAALFQSSEEEKENTLDLFSFQLSQEPLVKLSEQEKTFIRSQLEIRSLELALFRQLENSLGQEFHSFDNYDYEKSKEKQLNSFVKDAKVRNEIVLALPEDIRKKIKKPTLISCARWLLSFFNSQSKDHLTANLFGKDNFSLRMTRVLELGLESWYTLPSQIDEVRAALQVMSYAGLISSFYETGVLGRFVILS